MNNMETTLLVSNLLLWVLVLGLGGVVILLSRQIGVLHERITPVGALMVGRGLQPGDASPVSRSTISMTRTRP